jgi:broad specificity phosphatase PhoE
MGTLYLVRHGQASFGADNYDQLSELGHRQSVCLGEYFARKGIHFETAITGTLMRHVQTWNGIAEGAKLAHEPLALSGLNEYDSAAVIAAIHPDPMPKPTTPEAIRNHFRLMRDGLVQWANGAVKPAGMPSYPQWVQGITDALEHVKSKHQGNVLLVSSGGPIATAVGHILGTRPEVSIELNLRIRNTAVTEFSFTPKRHALLTFNTLPHLDGPDHKDWISYT